MRYERDRSQQFGVFASLVSSDPSGQGPGESTLKAVVTPAIFVCGHSRNFDEQGQSVRGEFPIQYEWTRDPPRPDKGYTRLDSLFRQWGTKTR